MKVAFPAQLTGVASKADRTFKLTFNTAELGEDAAKLMDLLMAEGYVLFSPNDDLSETDIPEVKADPGLQEKSPSQRLRNVLNVYWNQKGKPGTWETFYSSQMERLIETIKAKLEPQDRS